MPLYKRFFGLLMAICLLAPYLFFTCLQVQQRYQQWLAVEALESAVLQTVSINSSNVQWIEKDKELRINGKLFDVKTWQQRGNIIIATGLYDAAETAIVKKIAQAQDQKNAPFQASLIQLFKISARLHESCIVLAASPGLLLKQTSTCYFLLLCKGFFLQHYPPPQA